ncbi:MAG: carboxypeptidase M32 [Syntrophobacterales bacterium]|nr:carboxypeptidase M32 [Syntrophobacterales bacterium]
MKPHEAYQRLVRWSKEITTIENIIGLLRWDQSCYMPPKGYKHRAEQISFLTMEKHQRLRDDRIEEWLEKAEEAFHGDDPHSPERANIREWRRWFLKARKVPLEIAKEIARVTSEANHIWEKARKENNWKLFEPYLEQIFSLKTEEAEALGYREDPYDPLLDEFEPDFSSKDFDGILKILLPTLKELLERILENPVKIDSSCLYRHFPIPLQERFGLLVAKKLGYDFDAGRLDITTHPFTVSISPEDVRVTTRYREDDFSLSFFAVVHEVGHALYDQGLTKDYWGTPAGMAVSLGIHESQSRFWENMVAKSYAFWKFWYPSLLQYFPILTDVPLETFWKALNRVQPSLVRIQADELTYPFHIAIRYEIERYALKKDLKVSDIPNYWSEKMEYYLGLKPSSFVEGPLQDIHWSVGLIGYFPTYLLGNIYAAQFLSRMQRDLGGDIDKFIETGLFGIILGWLREHIHQKGSRFLPKELLEDVTKSPPDPSFFVKYLKDRLGSIYNL